MFNFCWHKWGKWGAPENATITYMFHRTETVTVQRRECERCGKIQTREVK